MTTATLPRRADSPLSSREDHGARRWFARLPIAAWSVNLRPGAMAMLAALVRVEALSPHRTGTPWAEAVTASGLTDRGARSAVDELADVGLVDVEATDGGHRRTVTVRRAGRWVPVPLIDAATIAALPTPRALWLLWGQCLAVAEDGRPWSTPQVADAIGIAPSSARRWAAELRAAGLIDGDGAPVFDRWAVTLDAPPRRRRGRPKRNAVSAETERRERGTTPVEIPENPPTPQRPTDRRHRERRGGRGAQIASGRAVVDALHRAGSRWAPLLDDLRPTDLRRIGAAALDLDLEIEAIAAQVPDDRLDTVTDPARVLAHRITHRERTMTTPPPDRYNRPEPIPLPVFVPDLDAPPIDTAAEIGRSGLAAARRALDRGSRL